MCYSNYSRIPPIPDSFLTSCPLLYFFLSFWKPLSSIAAGPYVHRYRVDQSTMDNIPKEVGLFLLESPTFSSLTRNGVSWGPSPSMLECWQVLCGHTQCAHLCSCQFTSRWNYFILIFPELWFVQSFCPWSTMFFSFTYLPSHSSCSFVYFYFWRDTAVRQIFFLGRCNTHIYSPPKGSPWENKG